MLQTIVDLNFLSEIITANTHSTRSGLHKKTNSCWCATVPALSGCHTWAENYDDLMVMVKEAIEGWLEVSHDKKLLDRKENQQLVEICV